MCDPSAASASAHSSTGGPTRRELPCAGETSRTAGGGGGTSSWASTRTRKRAAPSPRPSLAFSLSRYSPAAPKVAEVSRASGWEKETAPGGAPVVSHCRERAPVAVFGVMQHFLTVSKRLGEGWPQTCRG